jgi:hypothetical protein
MGRKAGCEPHSRAMCRTNWDHDYWAAHGTETLGDTLWSHVFFKQQLDPLRRGRAGTRSFAPINLIKCSPVPPTFSHPIVFFSSDATALYRGDVFRCLALPEGHTIQFRYSTKWMHKELATDPRSVKGRFGLIVFVGGNNQSLQIYHRRLRFEPVRFCTVKDVVFDYDIQQVTLILELDQFVKCTFKVTQGPASNVFVAPGEITSYEPTSWVECVKRLECYFSNTLFFRLSHVFDDCGEVKPSYVPALRLSRFDL